MHQDSFQTALGPIGFYLAARRPVRARVLALLVLASCIALLTIAGRLQPDSSGVGTHRQLGFPPCLPIALFGYPCPTCGMTTAFAHGVRGHIIAAFNAQPAGLAAALLTILATGLSLGVIATGNVWIPNWYRLRPERVAVGLVLFILGAWAYKLITGVMDGTLPYR